MCDFLKNIQKSYWPQGTCIHYYITDPKVNAYITYITDPTVIA